MALAELQPVNRDSTAAIIAEQLRAAIMNGSLPPGTQLGEVDLAAKFQVSRGPLREAMQRLVQEGLLRSERHRGLFVIDLEPADVFDIYTTRNAIEQAAATLIMRGGRAEQAAGALEEVLAEMRAAVRRGDPHAASDADSRFHEVLVAASGSRRLTRMARTLLTETGMCIAALQRTYEVPDAQVAEHTGIVDAIRGGRESLLLKLIDSHMEDGIRRLLPGYSLHGPGPEPSEPPSSAGAADAPARPARPRTRRRSAARKPAG
ncbi:GntR family transcriptional regulator [Gandjariella thermophila]|uniref:GntR family transcriptional regulator n=1 Tax=Gandjariella thermophila TaxID=1931992 RepID=A0A4D4JD63_9PSEU|nr:GntR family transcriptional regulator [Gandjariella thermophila]GDY33574.1 GntR family transcriptional regulator [Gandjariella thermophila]